jgi:pectate lyase
MTKRTVLLAVVVGLFLACSSGPESAPSGTDGVSPGSGATGSGATGGGTSLGGAGGVGGAGTGGSGAVAEPGTIIIQEDELGFSAVDGLILPRQGSTSVTGYTGTGFADGDSGVGKTISWSVEAATAGEYPLIWRYAFGGTMTNLRDAELRVNGVTRTPSVTFPYTGTWNDWQETASLPVRLDAGQNFIQLIALHESGLANVDYVKLIGEGLTPSTPSFSLTLSTNDPAGGSVSYEPLQDFYPQGTQITLHAVPNPGYFFQSWSGDVTGIAADHTFAIQANTAVSAVFLPEGTVQDPGLVGYASVQDDMGTPYIVTGGALGQTVTATTLEELETNLGRPEPLVVQFSGQFQGADEISIASNKTLLGVGADAHLLGIGLSVNGSRNVIVRNVAVSHVVADGTSPVNDAIEITGGARNVWIDHCALFSDRLNGEDYYDGLLEIKNGASFITVSFTEFYDHFKVSLISSGDEQVGDTVIRATYHHNYFHDVGSRLPSIRFGKAHVFNNYYVNVATTGVNSRMGAVVKVENNYFLSSDDSIGSWDSAQPGTWDVSDNIFDACTGSQPTTSNGSLVLPYQYSVDAPADVPALVMAGAGVGRL